LALEELEGLTGQVMVTVSSAARAGQVLLDLILELAEEILAQAEQQLHRELLLPQLSA
jgi:hypothetical protein